MSRVLLLHGVGSSAAVWWRMQRDLADLGHEVTALELLGHGGRTDGPDRPWTLDDFARDVLERAEPVDLVVGHSLGSVVALTAAALRPQLTGAVLLEDPPGGATLGAEAAADGIEQAVAAIAADGVDAVVAATLTENPAWAALDARHMVAARASVDAHRVTEFLRSKPWAPDMLLGEWPVPVHLLVAEGPGSALTEPVRSALLAKLGDRVTAVGSGHSVYRDRPGIWLRTVTRILET